MSNAQKKFEEASEKFLKALQNLEEITTIKLQEIATNSDNVDVKNKVIEQEAIITNLSTELNNVQKTMNDIGKENDFLKDKNNFFADKIFKFKSQGPKIIQAVEDDLTRIRTILKSEGL